MFGAKQVFGNWTVGKKLAAMGTVAVLGALIVGYSGALGVGSVGDAIAIETVTAKALRNHMNGDMMHDALRADVFAALLATTDAEKETVRANVKDHAAAFESMLAANKALPLSPTVRSALDEISTPLVDYIAAAKAESEIALTDKVQAKAKLESFQAVFHKLEKLQAVASDKITKAADVAVKAANQEVQTAQRSIWIAVACATLALFAICLRIAKLITGPLRRSVLSLQQLAAKDLTAIIEVTSTDESAQMAEALNTALGSLSGALDAISRSSTTLGHASDDLAAVSSEIAASAEETSVQSGVVSIAGDEVSANVSAVATAVEQMTASVQEIAQSTTEAARVAQEAVDLAEATNRDVARLGEASMEIGNVVKVITGIAEQTNLLALNATIEAARAGDSGKGFAVVANEVKELANETAKATEDIARRITEIQSQTVHAVGSIQQISEIIGRISDYQNSIAGAVEEQAATTHEIGRSVGDAARGSSEIALNIAGIACAAQTTAEGIANTQMAAVDLGRVAQELSDLVGQFKYVSP